MIYYWYHNNDLLASDHSLEVILGKIKDSKMIQPDIGKMMKCLREDGEFIYAGGIYRVEKK